MPFEEAAAQMRAAYDNVLGGGWRQVDHAVLAPYAMTEVKFRRRGGEAGSAF